MTSSKRPWFARLAARYARRRLAREFAEVNVAGLERLRALLTTGPLILAPNHVAWWDVFVCVALDARLGGGGHALMDASNLQRLPFFGWVGAVPLDRRRAGSAYRDLGRAGTLLQGPGEYLILFPQGQQRPAHLPLDFRPGIAWLAQRGRARVVPVGLRYEFGEGPRPRIFVAIGEALPPLPKRDLLRAIESAVSEQLAVIDGELLRRLQPCPGSSVFEPLVPADARPELPRGSRWLARLTGGEQP